MADLEQLGALVELGRAQIERLRGFVEERTLSDGTVLFHADDESQELYWIAEGSVRLTHGGREQGLLETGDMLGALSLAVVGARACDARVQGKARVYALGREAYLRMRSDDPELALLLQEAIVRMLARDLRQLLQS